LDDLHITQLYIDFIQLVCCSGNLSEHSNRWVFVDKVDHRLNGNVQIHSVVISPQGVYVANKGVRRG